MNAHIKKILIFIFIFSIYVLSGCQKKNGGDFPAIELNISSLSSDEYVTVSDNGAIDTEQSRSENLMWNSSSETEDVKYVFFSPTDENPALYTNTRDFGAFLNVNKDVVNNDKDLIKHLPCTNIMVYTTVSGNAPKFLEAYADAATGINIKAGEYENWHFDSSNFYVSSLGIDGITFIKEYSPIYNPLHEVESGTNEKGHPYLVTSRLIYDYDTEQYTKPSYKYYEDFGCEYEGYRFVGIFSFEMTDCTVEDVKKHASDYTFEFRFPIDNIIENNEPDNSHE